MRCAVFGCHSDNQAKGFNKDVQFFSFPKDSVVRQLWVVACCRSDVFNANNARVCSKHFSEEDYERNLKYQLLNYLPKKGRKLKSEAVPSSFLPKEKSLETNKTPREDRGRKRKPKKLVKEVTEITNDFPTDEKRRQTGTKACGLENKDLKKSEAVPSLKLEPSNKNDLKQSTVQDGSTSAVSNLNSEESDLQQESTSGINNLHSEQSGLENGSTLIIIHSVQPKLQAGGVAYALSNLPIEHAVNVTEPNDENEHKLLSEELIIDDVKQESPIDDTEEGSPVDDVKQEFPIDINHESPVDDIKQDTPVEDIKQESPFDDISQESPVDDINPESPVDDINQGSPNNDIKQEFPVDESTTVETEEPPPKIPRYIGDLSAQDFSTPEKREKTLMSVKNVVSEYRADIYLLNKEKKKLEQTVSSMKDLLEKLKSNESLSKEASAAILVFTEGWNPIFYKEYVGKEVNL